MITKIEELLAGKGWETRKRILNEISSRPMSAYELAKKLNLNYSTVKYHLELLERTGLVAHKKDRGNRHLYQPTRNARLLYQSE
ncbi:MAG: winged helix-turn-helix domain-containing protein [Candidatus Aramenus sp.]|jgi:predicted transcriptional regulator|nr:winged helix-turn-helix domain-containing protein [Candidatus Aramenus sp.]